MTSNLISVINGYKLPNFDTVLFYYIGRSNKSKNIKGSALANPFIINVHGNREEVVQLYDQYLEYILNKHFTDTAFDPTTFTYPKPIDESYFWDEIYNPVIDELLFLSRAYLNKIKIKLICYCDPQLCHGSSIIKVITKHAKDIVDYY